MPSEATNTYRWQSIIIVVPFYLGLTIAKWTTATVLVLEDPSCRMLLCFVVPKEPIGSR